MKMRFCLLAANGLTNFYGPSDSIETSGTNFPLFCQCGSIFDGEGKWKCDFHLSLFFLCSS